MSRIVFRVTGNKKIDKMFAAMPKKVQNKILRDEIKKAAKPMHDSAKAMAPVGEEGMLKRSIKQRAMKRKRNHVGRSVIVDPKFFADQAEGMRKFVAGMFMEFGTRSGVTDKQQYMRPAFKKNKDAVLHKALENIKTRIETEAKSGA